MVSIGHSTGWDERVLGWAGLGWRVGDGVPRRAAVRVRAGRPSPSQRQGQGPSGGGGLRSREQSCSDGPGQAEAAHGHRLATQPGHREQRSASREDRVTDVLSRTNCDLPPGLALRAFPAKDKQDGEAGSAGALGARSGAAWGSGLPAQGVCPTWHPRRSQGSLRPFLGAGLSDLGGGPGG